MSRKNKRKYNKLTPARKAWVIRKIKSGKSKYKTAVELNLRPDAVYKFAKHLPSKPSGWPGIRGRSLKILQDLSIKGWSMPTGTNIYCQYFTLKKYFPNIRKVSMFGRNIYFFEDKGDAAARAFLENAHKKIVSYQKLKQITRYLMLN